MKVLIGCEISGTIRDAFLRKGHDAISCDLEPTDVPGPHYQGSVLDIIDDGFDLGIFNPPCTFVANSGAQWLWHPEDKNLPPEKRRPHPMYPTRMEDLLDAVKF